MSHQALSKSFLFNENDVVFREELKLTEKQRSNVRHFFESDWKPAYIDVLPTTILVHRELAERKLEIKRCVFITGPDPEHISVLPAPKFCCRKPVNRAAVLPRLNSFVNMEKYDLKAIKASDTGPAMPPIYDKRSCYFCNKQTSDKPESNLFSLVCGHLTCRSCWLEHCKWYLAREMPIPCPNGNCNETLTLSRAATLLADSTIAIMLEYEWRHKLRQATNLQCAGCKHWMEGTGTILAGRLGGTAAGGIDFVKR